MEQYHGLEGHDGPDHGGSDRPAPEHPAPGHPARGHPARDNDGGTDFHAFVRSQRGELERQLAEWVRVPGVLGVPEHAQDLLRSANWLAAAFRDVGFPVVEVLPTGESHAVYAEWCEASGAPTVLVYSHHDVRVAKPGQWDQTAPFEPAVRDGRLYGRGSSDAKGQVLAHLWSLRAHLHQRVVEPVETRPVETRPVVEPVEARPVVEPAQTQPAQSRAPAINLKYLVEGEEEAGSPHLARLLEEQGDRLNADFVLFSDTLLFRADHPALCVSLRGMLSAHLELTGPEVDVHSGAVSGAAPNPAFELSRLLAGLHDENGRIAIPGFYDDVAPVPEHIREALAHLPFTEQDWLERSESGSITGEKGFTVPERLWLRPAVEVTALIAGDPAGLSSAAVPSVASVDLSFRTVMGQRAEKVAEQFRQWVQDTVGESYGHTLSVDLETAQEPYRTPDHPAVSALERAMANGFRSATVGRMGNAGGGPAELLSRSLDAPVLFFGTGLVEDHWHDSDESASLEVLVNGAATLACFWDELARME
ncbi:acetylornithine deacetylase/succinyl-diaminopimelate desuccinylase-like protein [Arthrobacter sp. SLBN-100]|uniref:M20/M25/M40 family metallo-hydrolase n=1 Tax=Arthrobacter sp. SLBN-100 TaxID=2768450 RepID=UPI00114EEBA0|nr:M20/M25/M40 family metallo-hydrolase [Arthrobacter sp. SLBN-100]TQJ67778.1 acetylornithine deacetylase/succinyl-diaminopimelate desuccinylase-like protein [Arthrobacter sp. SLBN-100]